MGDVGKALSWYKLFCYCNQKVIAVWYFGPEQERFPTEALWHDHAIKTPIYRSGIYTCQAHGDGPSGPSKQYRKG